VELLNPESMSTFGRDFVSGPRKLSIVTSSLTSRGHHTPTEQSEPDIDHSELHDNGTAEGTSGRISNGRVSKIYREQSLGSSADERLERLSIAESEGSEGTASTDTKVATQSSGRSFIGNVMDTFMLKNTTFRSVRAKPVEAPASDSFQDLDVGDQDPDESKQESVLLQSVRTKCVTQLLLLGALDSFQKNHWQRLQPSHKRLFMDILSSMADFAASYNSDLNLRSRMQHVCGDRPPPNLLRLETEGAHVYLAVLNKTATQTGDEVEGTGEPDLREEAETRLVLYCGHILKEVSTLQPATREAVDADYHRALGLRSPVTVQVLNAMKNMDSSMFKKHLSEFYPYFTKLICSDQMDVRKALGELFRVQLVALLP
jgi:guanine nucleotide-exchange factor